MKAQSIIVLVCTTITWSNVAFAKKAKDDAKVDTSGVEAPAAAPAVPGQPGSEKLDVTDLENKYWAPKDTDFSVVQNRTYTKEKKFFLSLQYGPDLNQTYLDGYQLGANVNYFWSERMGLQFTYLKSFLRSNRVLGDLATYGGGIQPDHGIMTSYYGVGFNWVPFYSKMSFLGKKILYFDMAITPTIGITNYDQLTDQDKTSQSAFTYGFDITQYYFFTDHFAFRADLKNQWYDEKIVGYSTQTQRGVYKRTQNDREMCFLLGFSFYFGK